MIANVIILAQGSQTRLPELAIPKQLLPLPDCGNAPILERTFCQLSVIVPDARITLVASDAIISKALKFSASSSVTYCTLPDPGNSSLKGLDRYLKLNEDLENERSTVVLLGDVIYSWACLTKIFLMGEPLVRFVGSSDLSPSGGEIWGVAWWLGARDTMMAALEGALAKHPPASVNDTYQPGQLRRLLWAIDASQGEIDDEVLVYSRDGDGLFNARRRDRPWFVAVDDYTMDVDIPEHLTLLGPSSTLAALDDKEHGLVW